MTSDLVGESVELVSIDEGYESRVISDLVRFR